MHVHVLTAGIALLFLFVCSELVHHKQRVCCVVDIVILHYELCAWARDIDSMINK